MKLKKLVPAALSLALVLSLAACGGGTTNSPAPETDSPAASTDSPAASTETAAPEDDGSLQRVLDAGVLTVGNEGNWLPYVYNEDGTGELTGFEVEVAREVAARLGVEVEFQTADSWDPVLAGLDASRYDVVISGVNPNPERQEKYACSIAYAENPYCLVVNGDGIPQEMTLVENLLKNVDNLGTVVLSIHKKPGNAVLGDRFRTLYGPGYIEDRLCGLSFRLSPRSFYQVNHDQAQQLYEAAVELAALTGTETAVDLYCGTGTISLVLARKAGRVIGVGIIDQAVADARENARRNGLDNAEFRCADASHAAAQLAAEGIRPDVIVVDPPRKGLDEAGMDAMVQMDPEKIVYISCDPATLARDLKYLTARGYRLTTARAYDMFPKCAHVETVVSLHRD